MSRMISAALLLVSMATSGSVFAQQSGEVGTSPPASAGASVSSALPAPAAPSGEAVVGSIPPPPAPITIKRPPRYKSSVPPAEVTVENGRNTVFTVALFHVNRIITPFRNPEIRTSSTATLTVENGIVYVTTQADDPIGLFVFEKTDPAQAISLTLNPATVSPVSVRINLAGYATSQASFAVTGDPEKARTWETEDPYITTIKALFKDLAANKLPQGYSLSALPGRYAYMPSCAIGGVQIVPMQIVEGAEITAIVARVTNVSYQTIDVNESSCTSSRLIGAATWPANQLQPGQATELYLAIRTPSANDGLNERPSVVGGR